MPRFINPYENLSGRWFRGTAHAHPKQNAPEKAKRLKAIGYDFVCFTEHDRVVPTAHLNEPDFLVIEGAECADPHVCVIGIDEAPAPVPREGGLRKIARFAAGHRAVAILNHPMMWGVTPREIMEAEGLTGMEICNFRMQSKTGYMADQLWDMVLRSGMRLWGFVSDDMHKAEEGGRGWIYVNAPELSKEAILESIRRGRFFSSTGPRIESMSASPEAISVSCTAAKRIEFITAVNRGLGVDAPFGSYITGANFPLEGLDIPRLQYIRVEIHAADGGRAWSNPIFIIA